MYMSQAVAAFLTMGGLAHLTMAAPAPLNSTHLETRAPGTASVTNKCNIDVFITVCDQTGNPCVSKGTIPAHTGVYSETYNSILGNGVSIKIGPQADTGQKTLQLEYANEKGHGGVNYDVSEVNGNPFGDKGGFTILGCAGEKCPPPSTNCPNVFTEPTNGNPKYCPLASNIGVILCKS